MKTIRADFPHAQMQIDLGRRGDTHGAISSPRIDRWPRAMTSRATPTSSFPRTSSVFQSFALSDLLVPGC
jgi:hypothetical protein